MENSICLHNPVHPEEGLSLSKARLEGRGKVLRDAASTEFIQSDAAGAVEGLSGSSGRTGKARRG